MRLPFYGTEAEPPTRRTAETFGDSDEPIPLPGGQGTSFRAGHLVLKPVAIEEEARWLADLFENLASSPEVRFARPVRSLSGAWISNGYAAWQFLEGTHVRGHYDRKLAASRAFHQTLKDVDRPPLLSRPFDSWEAANRVVWQEREARYPREFSELIDQILPRLRPVTAPAQLVHGDLCGNFLFEADTPPAIIDMSLTWAPSGFAEGILFADALAWENAEPGDLSPFSTVPDREQFAWRGILRRVCEQAEHITWLNKGQDQALEDARAYQRAIDVLVELRA